MQAIVIVAWAAAAWWALALVVRVFMVAATFVQPLARRRAAVRGDHPPVSIVIPIARMEPEMEAALTSVFAQDHPGLEVLISAAERESAVIDLARRVADRFPDVAVRFMLGNERRTLNPKVSNLAPAIEAASNDLVLVVDSNITLRDGQLAALVRNLTPGIGMVCAITIGVKPKGFPAEIGCAMTNAHAAPAMMAGALFGGDIGFGKVMLFDRRHYRAVDGPRVMGSSFGDDVALAKALGRAGLRTVLAGEVIRQTIGARTLGEVWDRQLRWMIIRRDERGRPIM